MPNVITRNVISSYYFMRLYYVENDLSQFCVQIIEKGVAVFSISTSPTQSVN